jgi:hypothetical protein
MVPPGAPPRTSTGRSSMLPKPVPARRASSPVEASASGDQRTSISYGGMLTTSPCTSSADCTRWPRTKVPLVLVSRSSTPRGPRRSEA